MLNVKSIIYPENNLLRLQFIDNIEVAGRGKNNNIKGYSLRCVLTRYQPYSDIDSEELNNLLVYAAKFFSALDHHLIDGKIIDLINEVKNKFHFINFIEVNKFINKPILKKNHFIFYDPQLDAQQYVPGMFKFALLPNIEISDIYLPYEKIQIIKQSNRFVLVESAFEKIIKEFIVLNYNKFIKKFIIDDIDCSKFITFNKQFIDEFIKFCNNCTLFGLLNEFIKPEDIHIEFRAIFNC